MTSYVYETPNEKALSGAFALVMHGLFFAMLVLSVNWQRQEPPAMMAELWSNLPTPKSEVPPPPPPPAPKVEPEPPKPAPKVEPKPEPKVEPKPEPKADIDLREKKEKERKAKEELAEKKKQQQQELAEKKKREEREKVEAQKLAQAKEAADAKRKAQEQADAQKKLAAQQAQQAAQQAAARETELNKYKQAVAARIKRFIVEPPSLQGNPEVEFEVIQLPGGEILGIKTTKGSGQAIWDNAVERAIQRAQPLPSPPDPAMFKDVRELHLKFRPKD